MFSYAIPNGLEINRLYCHNPWGVFWKIGWNWVSLDGMSQKVSKYPSYKVSNMAIHFPAHRKIHVQIRWPLWWLLKNTDRDGRWCTVIIITTAVPTAMVAGRGKPAGSSRTPAARCMQPVGIDSAGATITDHENAPNKILKAYFRPSYDPHFRPWIATKARAMCHQTVMQINMPFILRIPTSTWWNSSSTSPNGLRLPVSVKVSIHFRMDANIHFIWKSVPDLSPAPTSYSTECRRPILFGDQHPEFWKLECDYIWTRASKTLKVHVQNKFDADFRKVDVGVETKLVADLRRAEGYLSKYHHLSEAQWK